jgi:2-oxoisovalerate dehydrogenase E1 component
MGHREPGGRGRHVGIADDCFPWLDTPVRRIGSTDTFVGYAPQLEDAILPQVNAFRTAYEEIVRF